MNRSAFSRSSSAWMRLLLPILAAGMAGSMAWADTNAAPSGTAILGVNTGNFSVLGTSQSSGGAGNIAHINHTATKGVAGSSGWADNYVANPGPGNYGYVGILWSTTMTTTQVNSLNLYMDLFNNGGWFGPSGTTITSNKLSSANLSPNNLDVQVTSNGGVSWLDVPFTSNYLTAMTGVTVTGSSSFVLAPEVTFTLTAPPTNINGIRIIGHDGGDGSVTVGGNGFIGINQLEVEVGAVPEPSTWALVGAACLVLFAAARRLAGSPAV